MVVVVHLHLIGQWARTRLPVTSRNSRLVVSAKRIGIPVLLTSFAELVLHRLGSYLFGLEFDFGLQALAERKGLNVQRVAGAG